MLFFKCGGIKYSGSHLLIPAFGKLRQKDHFEFKVS